MTASKQSENVWTKRIMDALPVVTIMLVSWICFSIIQLQSKVEVVNNNIAALLAAKNTNDMANSNERRIKDLEGRSAEPVGSTPVTVVNPPSAPVPVEPAPRPKQ